MSGDSTEDIPDRVELEQAYERRKPTYQALLDRMEKLVGSKLEAHGIHPTIKGRIKSFDSIYKKRIRFLRQARLSSKAPLPITDIVGLRVVCPFLGDLGAAERVIQAAFTVTEVERKGAERSFREFGYESIHILVRPPADFLAEHPDLDIAVCEIQLRTILQEAWAEVEHELVYKAEFTPFDEPLKRKLAALNANLTLSDIIFQEIRDYQHRLTEELAQRRDDFYSRIEEFIDQPFSRELGEKGPREKGQNGGKRGAAAKAAEKEKGVEAGYSVVDHPRLAQGASLDDMLLEALYVHNRGDYDAAIKIYSDILASKPAKEVGSVLHRHRGMAYFSKGKYQEAVADFNRALELDPRCAQAAYFRGVVRTVLEDYGGALSDYDLSLSINPFQHFALYRRAQAYWHIGDYAKALADCESALRLEPGQREVEELKQLALQKLLR
jgi:putative GTP pyrophosphokinase